MDRLPFEPSSVVRLITAFANLPGDDEGSDLPSIEQAGTLLWDLSADEEATSFLLKEQLVFVITTQLNACIKAVADGSAVLPNSSMRTSRVVELCFGILANLCAFPQAAACITADRAVLPALLALLTSLDDPPALAEVCRTLSAAVSSPQGWPNWLPTLQQQPAILARLMLLVQHTLHPQLLQYSLQLLAVLLKVDADQNTGEQQQQQWDEVQQMWPLLMQAGLMDAVAAVLVPAAGCDTAAAAAAVATTAAAAAAALAGGWDASSPDFSTRQDNSIAAAVEARGRCATGEWSDEEDATAAGGAFVRYSNGKHGSESQLHQLYRQEEVLEALLAVLEQIGMQPAAADEALQRLHELPVLLLQLLQHCSRAGQQMTLELLLPVLVMFGAHGVPCLQQQQLRYLLCVGAILQDCTGQDSLDALDAGWYLCALGTTNWWQQQQGLEAGGGHQEQQQGLEAGKDDQEQQQHYSSIPSGSALYTTNHFRELSHTLPLRDCYSQRESKEYLQQQQQQDARSGNPQHQQQEQRQECCHTNSAACSHTMNSQFEEYSNQQTRSTQGPTYLPSAAGCQLLERFCCCLSRAQLPETAHSYARTVVKNILAAVETVLLHLQRFQALTQSQQCDRQLPSSDRLQADNTSCTCPTAAAVQHLLHALRHLKQVLQNTARPGRGSRPEQDAELEVQGDVAVKQQQRQQVADKLLFDGLGLLEQHLLDLSCNASKQ